jgi:hypothetical protein
MHAWMNRYLLANNIIIANYQTTDLRIVVDAKQLRQASNHAVGKKMVVLPDFDILANNYIRIKYRAGTYRNTLVNNTIRADYHVLA